MFYQTNEFENTTGAKYHFAKLLLRDSLFGKTTLYIYICVYIFISLFKLGYNILKATYYTTWVYIHQKSEKYNKARFNWMLNMQ